MTSVRCLQSAESTQYSNKPIDIGQSRSAARAMELLTLIEDRLHG